MRWAVLLLVAGCGRVGFDAGTPLTAGVDYYFVVECAAGGCVAIDFSVQ